MSWTKFNLRENIKRAEPCTKLNLVDIELDGPCRERKLNLS